MGVFARKRSNGKTTYYVGFMVGKKPVQERSGTDRRAAERLYRQRLREVKAGAYSPQHRSGSVSVGQYATTWGENRKNKTASDDRQRLRDYFTGPFGSIRLNQFGTREAKAVVDYLASKVREGALAARTARNIKGVIVTMFRDACTEELIDSNPFGRLPKNVLPKPEPSERKVYTQAEVTTLLTDERIPDAVRIFLTLLLYTGVRQGEACGLRFGDWDDEADLGCLKVHSQYDGRSLKTGRPRKVPVHPALAEKLRRWRDQGFELVYTRKPTADDFIVPNRHTNGSHTKSSTYKALGRAHEAVGIPFHGCHHTRHTMITWTRRGGANADVLEQITHNAKGTIIDQYTHRDWETLCGAIDCLAYGHETALSPALHDAQHDAPPKNIVFRGRGGGGAGNRTRVRRASNQASFTCVVGKPHRHGW